MSAIINFSINLEKLPKDSIIKGKKGTYANLTMFVNDETMYGNNASVQLPMTKEERDNGKDRVFVGNGKVVWVSQGGITPAEREAVESGSPSIHPDDTEDDGLPF